MTDRLTQSHAIFCPLTFVCRHFTCQIDLPPGIRTAGCHFAVQLEVPREMYFDIDQVGSIMYVRHTSSLSCSRQLVRQIVTMLEWWVLTRSTLSGVRLHTSQRAVVINYICMIVMYANPEVTAPTLWCAEHCSVGVDAVQYAAPG